MEERPKLAKHEPRVIEDIRPCVSPELVPPRVGLPLSVPVCLPRMARPVVPIAVELHGESVIRPPAINATSACGAIGLGKWQALSP
jgi:hypothetical protein